MRKIWFSFVACAVVVLAAAVGVSAQSALKVAVMDLQVVMSESVAGKGANAKLAQFVQAKQTEIDELNADVDALQTELAGDNLAAADRTAKQEELDGLIDELQQMVTLAQSEINVQSQQLRDKVLNEIGQVLNIIGQERDYSLILDSSSVFYYKLVVDITWEVIRRYDELYTAATQGASAPQAEGAADQ